MHRVAGAAADLGGLEVRVGLLGEQRAQLRVVERRERPGQLQPGRSVRRVDHQPVERLAVRAHQVHRPQPLGRDAAGGRLALADLVAVEHQHAGAGAAQLARHGQPGEARAADQDVRVARQGRAVGATLGTAGRHAGNVATLVAAVPETETLTQPNIVEGSGGLLLEIDGQIVPNYDATIVPFEEGDVVSGKVVQIDQDEVLVDIGYKSEGVIPLGELSIRKSVDPHDEVDLGEEVDALVLTKEDQDGRLLLSKKRARFEKAWRKIEAAAESGEPVEGTVIEVVKGGLIIDLGVRGFLPASLVDIRRVQNLDEFLGTKIECKVIELNRSRNNVVLSRRAVLEEERKEVRQQILDRLQPGMIVEGAISNIVDFGAFVDLDGIDGLIHISELSWSHVNHPSEILAIGDVVPVKVLDIDRDRQRISLGLKQTQEDPWQRVIDTYRVGDELEGKVTKVVTFGAFVEIMDGRRGARAYKRAGAPPRREPARDPRAGPGRAREDPRDRLRAPPPVAEREAGGRAAGAHQDRRCRRRCRRGGQRGDRRRAGPRAVRGRVRGAAGERRGRPARRRRGLRHAGDRRGGAAAAGGAGGRRRGACRCRRGARRCGEEPAAPEAAAAAEPAAAPEEPAAAGGACRCREEPAAAAEEPAAEASRRGELPPTTRLPPTSPRSSPWPRSWG